MHKWVVDDVANAGDDNTMLVDIVLDRRDSGDCIAVGADDDIVADGVVVIASAVSMGLLLHSRGCHSVEKRPLRVCHPTCDGGK